MLSATDWWLDDTAWLDQDWWVDDPAAVGSWDEVALPVDGWESGSSGEFDESWPTVDDESANPDGEGDAGWLGDDPAGDPAEGTHDTDHDVGASESGQQVDVVPPEESAVLPAEEPPLEVESGDGWSGETSESAGGDEAGGPDASADTADATPDDVLESVFTDPEPADASSADGEPAPGDEFDPAPVEVTSEGDVGAPTTIPPAAPPVALPSSDAPIATPDAESPVATHDGGEDVGSVIAEHQEPVAATGTGTDADGIVQAAGPVPVIVPALGEVAFAGSGQPATAGGVVADPAEGSTVGTRPVTRAGIPGRSSAFGFGALWGSGSGNDADDFSASPGRRRGRWPFRPAD